ncbi:MAG TPA: hypothetical protein VEW46_08860 [Pyrinomonadaceae bacterium]|nr:hypothetical protein [Pyrinomonadaceae bacterium]
MNHYSNEPEIEAVVQGFENCTTAKEAFTHRQHLTVAVWYLYHSNEAQALEKMRMGLLRFLGHHGVAQGKYKEDLTVSWLRLIKAAIDEMDSNLPFLEITNNVLDRLSSSSLIKDISGPSG